MPENLKMDSPATTTPWEIYEGGNFVRIGLAGYREWCDKNGYMGGPLAVCEVQYRATDDYDADHEKAMGYARLIAAAPQLLDALNRFMDMWNSGDSGRSSKRAQQRRAEMWDCANAAIAKVEGRSNE